MSAASGMPMSGRSGRMIPAPRSVDDQRRDREQRDHGRDRALDQHADAERRPEAERGPEPGVLAGARLDIDARERRLGRDHRGQQHGVGLSEMRLQHRRDAGAEQGGGDERLAPAEQPLAYSESEEHRRDHAEQRRQPIGPHRGPGRIAERLDRRGLEPIDAGRLLVARLVLELDADEVAVLDHLARRLGEARLVAVERRQRHEARQVERERQQHQGEIGADAADEEGQEAAAPDAGSPPTPYRNWKGAPGMLSTTPPRGGVPARPRCDTPGPVTTQPEGPPLAVPSQTRIHEPQRGRARS